MNKWELWCEDEKCTRNWRRFGEVAPLVTFATTGRIPSSFSRLRCGNCGARVEIRRRTVERVSMDGREESIAAALANADLPSVPDPDDSVHDNTGN